MVQRTLAGAAGTVRRGKRNVVGVILEPMTRASPYETTSRSSCAGAVFSARVTGIELDCGGVDCRCPEERTCPVHDPALDLALEAFLIAVMP